MVNKLACKNLQVGGKGKRAKKLNKKFKKSFKKKHNLRKQSKALLDLFPFPLPQNFTCKTVCLHSPIVTETGLQTN